MFGMSMTEIVIILAVALLILGPKELPKAAKTIGKTLREVRRAGDDLRQTFEREIMSDDEDLPKRPTKAPEGAVSANALPEPPTDPAPSPAPADEPVRHEAPTADTKPGESA